MQLCYIQARRKAQAPARSCVLWASYKTLPTSYDNSARVVLWAAVQGSTQSCFSSVLQYASRRIGERCVVKQGDLSPFRHLASLTGSSTRRLDVSGAFSGCFGNASTTLRGASIHAYASAGDVRIVHSWLVQRKAARRRTPRVLPAGLCSAQQHYVSRPGARRARARADRQ